MATIRTRFAPSPTGFMHVGNLRTGLFAWLTARHANGAFILRLEDTDKNREVAGSADHIITCLNMLGLTRDEGIDTGGPYAPYIQSQRLDIYRAWAQTLIDAGRAYADPYSKEELDVFRAQAKQSKQPFLYRNHRPTQPPVWDGSTPLRFKSDPKAYAWHDEVMGNLKAGAEVVDDFILIKSDGYPTYNFAHIVDDAEMRITHVIRGQEFISSTPNYLNLYEALNITPPVFATMPHIMNEHGNKKLGKRDGAKDVLAYVQDGFLPETLLSFIATLGWNDGTEQELFTREELVSTFTLDRVQRSGARFDDKRLLWMNGQFIRLLPLDDLAQRVADFWPTSAIGSDETYKTHILALVQDRLKTLKDLPIITDYFFVDPTPDWTMVTTNKQLKKLPKEDSVALLTEARQLLEVTVFTPEALQESLNQLLETTGQTPGILFSLIRLAVSWAPFSPALPDTLAVLGKEVVIARITTAIRTA
ncbi:MAG: glutamate--tRNA ligase [Candidatus Saccharimonadales bacterium]